MTVNNAQTKEAMFIRSKLDSAGYTLYGLPEMKKAEQAQLYNYLQKNDFAVDEFIVLAKLFDCSLVDNVSREKAQPDASTIARLEAQAAKDAETIKELQEKVNVLSCCGTVRRCRSCKHFYLVGYVCECGRDNSMSDAERAETAAK